MANKHGSPIVRGFTIGLIFPLLSVTSCSNGHPNDEKDIEWSTLTEITSNDEFSSVIDFVDYIPLETNDRCLLGNIRKCELTDSFIYVLAEVAGGGVNELHQFDYGGHHIRQIGSRGDGPGEYGVVETFAITGDTLMLFDGYSSTIKCYNMDGNYMGIESSFVNPTGVTEIYPLNGTRRVLIRSNIGNFDPTIYSTMDVLDTLGIEPIASHTFDCRESMASITATGQIGRWDNDGILLVMPYSQDLYRLDMQSMNFTPVISIKTGSPIPDSKENESIYAYQKRVNENDIMTQMPLWACRSGKWLCIGFFCGGILWNLDTDIGFHTLNGVDTKKLKDFPFAMWNVLGAYGDSGFISWVSAEDILGICSVIPTNAKCKPPKEIYETISDENNPILLLYTMK